MAHGCRELDVSIARLSRIRHGWLDHVVSLFHNAERPGDSLEKDSSAKRTWRALLSGPEELFCAIVSELVGCTLSYCRLEGKTIADEHLVCI